MDGRRHALQRFARGAGCAEAVCLGVADALEIAEPRIGALARGLDGGIGGSGDTCGALLGAVLGVGLALDHRGPAARARDLTPVAARAIHDSFRREMGSTLCRDLTGVIPATREDAVSLNAPGVRPHVCRRAVGCAADFVMREVERSA